MEGPDPARYLCTINESDNKNCLLKSARQKAPMFLVSRDDVFRISLSLKKNDQKMPHQQKYKNYELTELNSEI